MYSIYYGTSIEYIYEYLIEGNVYFKCSACNTYGTLSAMASDASEQADIDGQSSSLTLPSAIPLVNLLYYARHFCS